MNEAEIFKQIGVPGITDMCAAFYKKVPTDDILGPMYPKDDLGGAEERLRDFLLFRIGSDNTYLEKRGHPKLRMRHAPFEINFRARDRWVKLMDEAMDEAGIPSDTAAALHTFFFQVADFLRNVREEEGRFKI
ncbi:MAG: hemoglobin [Cryomorphaceae bacterium]|jgi:hemoglobin